MKKLSTIALLGMVSGMVFAKAPENYTRHIEVCADASVLEGVTLENVPVLVRLSESISGFSYDDFQAYGLDLLFQDQVGAELPFEVDTWNPGGESLVWVKVPSLTKGTILHLYFGGEANVGSSADVWSEYAGVWHLSEADGVALDSTSHELHGTPMGSAAAAMVSTSGAIGSARVNSGNKSYLSIPNYNALGLGSTFTISAWFRANAVSGYPRYFSRKNSYADNDGWEIEAVNNSKTSLTARGVLNNKTVKSTFPDITKDWVFLSFVYNGANLSVYANGVLSASGAIDPATDNGRPMSIGSDSDGSETSFNGQFDEARLRDGCVDAAWVAAEYAMATDASFFTYGAVESTDSNTPFIAPGLELGLVNGVWTLSGTLASGSGTVYGVVTELFSGVAITSQVATADATVAPVAFSGALSSIPAGSMYSFYGFVESAQGGRSRMLGAYAIYSGEVSVEKVSDAQEVSLAPGAFVVRRADTPAATAADLLVTYSVSGTAVEGVTHEPLTGSLVLPAGVASVTLDVVPLFAPSVTEDTTVIVTLNQERAVVGNAGSATLTVVHSEENQFIRYVSPEGDDANDGLLPTKAKASIDGAVAVLNELVDEAHVGTVLVAAGTYMESGDTAVKVSESRGSRSDYSTNAVHIAAPIRVVGMTGNPEDVILTTSGNRRIAYLNHPKASLQFLTFYKGNGSIGTGVYMDSLGGEVVDCVFTECGSTHWEAQGALWMKAGYAGRCLFTKNKASRNGTALYMEGGLVENCLFTENNTAGAHTAYLKNAAVLLNSSVVYNNGTSGSGIQISGQNARVVNCAIFGNVAPSSVTGDTWAGTASGFVRCASGRAIEGGIDCLVGDPAFVDAENGDYRLMPASCCMDAGIDPADYAVASAMDYLKAPRVVGEAVDIGCYENQQDEATVSFLVEYDQFVLPARFEMTPVTMCIPDGATYEWDFGDGTIVTEHAPIPVQHTYVQAGEFTITLTVSFGEETLLSVYPSVFQLSPSVLYVNGGNADAAYPYDTPETGAATVADAVEAAVDGATIIVLRGTLVQSRQVEITKGITLRGETDDPSDVILANDASKINSDNSRIFIVNHPDAMVANLTMTRGSARANNAHGANVYIQAKGGTVSNCVIRSGRTQHFASYGAAVYMDNGLLTHTEITGEYVTVPNYNQDPSNKGVVVHLAGANARMENCLVHDVTLAKSENAPNYYDVSSCGPVVSVDAGMMVNCTIAPNCSAAGTASTDSNFMRYNGGAAIYCGNSGSVYNTVATGLINASGMLRAFSGNAASYHYCAGDAVLEETWAGEQCLFGMPTAFYQDLVAQDYRPNTKSPLIGGGTNAASAEGTDFAGKPRLSGITIDIGCYECNSNYTLLLFR